MNEDSKMWRSVENLVHPIILKSLIKIGTSHERTCSLILEWGGADKSEPVRKLLPAGSATLVCRARVVEPTYPDAQPAGSATLVCRARIVEPTYSDAQRAQLNVYTREDLIADGSLSLKLKNEPILKLFTKIIWKSTSLKYLCRRIERSDFIFSDWDPK